jgi:hypothetical protein
MIKAPAWINLTALLKIMEIVENYTKRMDDILMMV